jgi:hypothetical protein
MDNSSISSKNMIMPKFVKPNEAANTRLSLSANSQKMASENPVN